MQESANAKDKDFKYTIYLYTTKADRTIGGNYHFRGIEENVVRQSALSYPFSIHPLSTTCPQDKRKCH